MPSALIAMGERRRGGQRVATLGGRQAAGGQRVLQVDPARTGQVGVAVGGEAVAAVEVPAHVDDHRVGVRVEEVGVDDRGDHGSILPALAADSAACSTSRSGRPSAAAAAAASSCSTFTRPAATLTRTTCPSTVTVRSSRACGQRCTHGAAQPERARLAHEHRGRRPRCAPGRTARARCAPGVPSSSRSALAQASCAPAASSAAMVWAITSPVASSTLVSSSCAGLAGRRGHGVRGCGRRRRPARRSVARGCRPCRRRSRRPSTSIAGIGPNSSASAVISATPVGVASSRRSSMPRLGAPRRASSSSVAGAGLGSVPCAARTVP